MGEDSVLAPGCLHLLEHLGGMAQCEESGSTALMDTSIKGQFWSPCPIPVLTRSWWGWRLLVGC